MVLTCVAFVSAITIVGIQTTETEPVVVADAPSKETTIDLKEVNELRYELEDARNDIELLVADLQRARDLDTEYSNDFRTGKFVISAYSPFDNPNGINADGDPTNTATGTYPAPGTFAVDPNVIPYGSNVIIMYPDGTVERGVAEDTGGAIVNNRIDVYRHTFETAINFGKREAVVIWYD